MVDAWHDLGLAARQIPLPASELIGERLAQGDFQVAVIPLAIGLDPDLYPLLAASQTRMGGSNVSGLQDPELDKLLVAARTPVEIRRPDCGLRRAPGAPRDGINFGEKLVRETDRPNRIAACSRPSSLTRFW